MKFSIYNHIFRSERFGNLLYNAETNAFAELSDELYQQLLYVKETDDMKFLSSEIIDMLTKAKILVHEEDKNFFYRKRFKYFVQNFDLTSLGFALAPTTFCNFCCPYCFEENKKPTFMTEETEDQFISFIKKHEFIKNIELTWYGGEPLANFRTIKHILDKLENEEAIQLRYHSMVTNGYLLDESKSRYFADHPLNDIQITIDGSKKFHDKRRILKNGESTYDKIIRNIDGFFKHNKNTHVLVRANLDLTNKESFYDLTEDIMNRWGGELINVSPAFVRDHSDENSSCSMQCGILNREEHIQFLFDLYHEHGMNVDFYPEFKIGNCGAVNLNYYVVGPSGELYKCWNDIGVKERIVGYLDSDIIPNYDVLCQYMAGETMFDDAQCKKCSVFPICDGGCDWMRQKNINEGKHWDLCTYKKDHIEQFLEIHYEKKRKNSLSKYRNIITTN